MTSNKVIGIISYLPEDKRIAELRYKKLTQLLKDCHRLFHLPVIIVAQNWKVEPLKDPNVTVYNYPEKLGIVGARKELRKLFLSSPYDYLIMLDDDCELQGTSGTEYLRQIDQNPNCFIEFNKTLLKLFAVSKTLLAQVDYESLKPEEGEGFEDRVFVNKFRLFFPNQRRVFQNTGIEQHSNSTADPLSTWYTNQNLKEMLETTQRTIDKFRLN